MRVALLAEGVDRNCFFDSFDNVVGVVALLAEGVDRNMIISIRKDATDWSPSSRRAWIEMCWSGDKTTKNTVALLAEGVDRNYALNDVLYRYNWGRPPRGGRG